MSTKDSNAFYLEKGLKRTPVTMRPSTIEFLDEKRKEFTAQIKTTTQGEVVDAMSMVYMNNPEFASAVNAALRDILEHKVIQKAGRKEGWRKDKPDDAE
ncbi:hypothetical protein ACNAUY_08040 [Acinetobacter tibetensis]|uniref:hypothetical protein n=1 Tax=Acinetobacter tibetensis TaxID=2943497 RepID=UPI003A4D47BD